MKASGAEKLCYDNEDRPILPEVGEGTAVAGICEVGFYEIWKEF